MISGSSFIWDIFTGKLNYSSFSHFLKPKQIRTWLTDKPCRSQTVTVFVLCHILFPLSPKPALYYVSSHFSSVLPRSFSMDVSRVQINTSRSHSQVLTFWSWLIPRKVSHNVDPERRDESSFPKGTHLITVHLSKYIVII